MASLELLCSALNVIVGTSELLYSAEIVIVGTIIPTVIVGTIIPTICLKKKKYSDLLISIFLNEKRLTTLVLC